MRSQSASQTLPLQRRGMRSLLLALFLLAGLALSTAALAASDGFIDCDRLAADLRSLDVAADELPLDGAEHRDGDALDVDSLPLAESAVTPVLLLTPRVASIMREVFNALPEVAIDDVSDAGTAPPAEIVLKAAPQPAADVPPLVKAPQAVFPGTDADNSPFIPRFQRQMYRTDI